MIKNNIFIIAIRVCSVIGQFSLQLDIDWFQYAKPDIEAGQWWRFITGNLVHLSWRHFAMNALALIAIYFLFPNLLKTGGLFLVFILSGLSVTLGLWIFSPTIYWYVGLSGALHGVLITLLILDITVSKQGLNIALLLLVMAKLLWETLMGPIPGSESTAGGPVIVQAHLYGSIGGAIIATCFLIKKYNKYI